MAVDKKSDHVGNHGGAYIDNDGMRKQFTVVDHDKKLKISAHNPSEKESQEREEFLEKFLQERIETVLLLPAVNILGSSSGIYDSLVKKTSTSIEWDKEAVILHLTNNRTSFLPTMLWKRTVAMSHWHHPMWIEGDMKALRRGDWKKLIS